MFRIFICNLLQYVVNSYLASGGMMINTLNAELNPICRLLALLGAHHIFNISGLRVNKY
jgi:hypothetical protein